MRAGRLCLTSCLIAISLAACQSTGDDPRRAASRGADAVEAARLDPREPGVVGPAVIPDRSRPVTPVRGDARLGAWSVPFAWPVLAERAALLPDGRVYTEGPARPRLGATPGAAAGHTWDPSTGSQAPASKAPGIRASVARHATVITLGDGSSYVQGGLDRPFASVVSADGGRRDLAGVPAAALQPLHPRTFVGPGGWIYGFVEDGVYRVDPAGGGQFVNTGAFLGRRHGWSAPAVMLEPGRVMLAGGGPSADATHDVTVVDLRAAVPRGTSVAPLNVPRHWHNATLLPDGSVIVTGGGTRYNDEASAARRPELWDARTGQWRLLAAAEHSRLYNSTALLLPDATVLTAGGGAPGPVSRFDAEIFHPPYLFDAQGRPAVRLRVLEAPTSAAPGETVELTVDDPSRLARLTLVRAGDASSAFDAGQRFVELSPVRVGDRLRATLPREAGVITPGSWMLFAIDAQGVPSKAAMLAVTPAMRAPRFERVQVAARPGGEVLMREFRDGAWRPWESLGGRADGVPRAVAADDGARVVVVAPRQDGAVMVRTRDAGRWDDWRDLGVRSAGAPGLAWHDGQAWVGWRDHAGHAKVAVVGLQTTVNDLGGGLAGAPALVDGGDGKLYLFGRSVDDGVRYRVYDGVRWTGWLLHESGHAGGNVVASATDAGILVLAQGADMRLRGSALAPAGNEAWREVGRGLSGAPASVSWAGGSLVVGAGNDRTLWTRVREGESWGGEQPLGRPVLEVQSLVAAPGADVEVVIRTPDDQLLSARWDVPSRRWTGWAPVVTSTTGAPPRYSSGGGAARS